MDAIKRGRGRPRGGLLGAIRAKLAAMSPGQTETVGFDELTTKGRVRPNGYVARCAGLAAHDLGGARYTTMTMADHVWVRREA